MRSFIRRFSKNQRGQTTIEYVLILSVVAVLMVSMGKRLSTFLVGNGRCPGPGLICKIQGNFKVGLLDSSAGFRYFKMPH